VKVYDFLVGQGYNPGDIAVLMDDEPEGRCDPSRRPTRENIILELKELVWDAQPGDSLFFHYSGR
jgi:metacaspase-1